MTQSETKDIACITFDLDDTLWPFKSVLLNAQIQVRNHIRDTIPALQVAFEPENLLPLGKKIAQSKPQLRHQLTTLRLELYKAAASPFYDDMEEVQRIAAEAVEVFLYHRNQVKPFEGVSELLSSLSENFVLGAITNGNANFSQTSIAKYFDFYISAESAGATKPEAPIFAAAFTQAKKALGDNIDKKAVLHVGDDLRNDVYGANQFGFMSCWLNKEGDGTEHPELGRVEPNLNIATLSELEEALSSPEH